LSSRAESGRRSRWRGAYLRDAELLILDEPTAALDARSELEVFERFCGTDAGKDGVADLATASLQFGWRIASWFFRVAALIEEGNHQQLMAAGGVYAGMFEMQAASYR